MPQAIRSFRDLVVWQASMDLAMSVYVVADKLPATEKFELAGQMRRAAVSVPSNVAEGHAFRTMPKVYRKHIRTALGSLAELDTQLEIVQRQQYASSDVLRPTFEEVKRVGQLLHGLLRALRRSAGKGKSQGNDDR